MSNEEHDEDDLILNPDEIVRVIDLDDFIPGEGEGDEDFSGDDEDNDMETEQASAGPLQDDAVITFSGHKDAVICCQVSPTDADVVVTGGQDDIATVWNMKDASVIFNCTGHTDTVASVGFSHDGSLVATGDMKGLIKVWRVADGTEVWSFEAPEIEWLQWHHLAHVLLAGTKEGQVWMWKIPSGDCKTFTGHGPATNCGVFLPNGQHACVGYEDGAIKIWDLKSTTVTANITGFEGHKSAVFCMDTCSKGNLVLTGSGDMTAKLINPVNGKVVTTFQCGNGDQGEDDDDSVESVGFSLTHDYAVTGTLSGRLEIWDLPTKSVRHRCEHPCGIVKLKFSKTTAMFYVAGLDGCVRQYDSRNGQMVQIWQGHAAGIMDFSISGDESRLVTASEDNTAKVFDLTMTPR